MSNNLYKPAYPIMSKNKSKGLIRVLSRAELNSVKYCSDQILLCLYYKKQAVYFQIYDFCSYPRPTISRNMNLLIKSWNQVKIIGLDQKRPIFALTDRGIQHAERLLSSTLKIW